MLDAMGNACMNHTGALFIMMLGAFLLGLLLGYFLWHHYKEKVEKLMRELNRLKAEYKELQEEKENLQDRFDVLETERNNFEAAVVDLRGIKSNLNLKLRACMEENEKYAAAVAEKEAAQVEEKPTAETEKETVDPVPATSPGPQAVAAPAPDEQSEEVDENRALLGFENLQIIEGVGPKIEGLLKAAGYHNWDDVAKAKYEDLSAVLVNAGPRYKMHDPKTWADQARLATEGKWEQLIKFQKILDTGRVKKGDYHTPAKVEKLISQKIGFKSFAPDDLKIVEGIGPKIEELLKNAGITTWSELAEAGSQEIKRILEANKRFRLADPGTWPKQAKLAMDGDWKALKKYQDSLKGGR